MSYPVAYRGGAVARGFQTGPQVAFLDTKLQFQREQMLLPPPPPPSITYELPWRAWAAALAVWLTRLGEGQVEAPELEEENYERTFSEEWIEELAREAKAREVEEPPVRETYSVPAFAGWHSVFDCEVCAGQAAWNQGPYYAHFGPQACCTGNFKANIDANPFLPGHTYVDKWMRNPLRAGLASEMSFRHHWARDAGTPDRAEPWKPQVGKIVLPAEPNEDGDVAGYSPMYEDAWALPVNAPGEVRPPFRVVWPYWFAQPRRPVLPPAVRPRPIWSEPLVADPFEWAPARDPLERPRPQVDPLVGYPTGDPLVDPVIDPVVAPDPWFPPTPDPWVDPFTGDPVVDPEPKAEASTGGVTTTGTRFPGPPEAGTSELKGKGRKFIGIFKAIINIVTEFGDFVDALWKALPKEFRHKCKHKNGKRRKCNTHDKIMDIGDALRAGAMDWETGYWKEALIQLLTNEVVDQFYGRVGQLYAKASAKAFPDGGGRGWQTGNWLKPRVHVKGEGVSDTVERYVRAAVEKAAHALD